jgi:hypothetical protein
MKLEQALLETNFFAKPETLRNFQRDLPQEWIERALSLNKGSATLRRRRLPSEQVIWLVLGMALFRDRPIYEVVDKLDLALPDPKETKVGVAPSAIPQARSRLGSEPMEWLFARSAEEWAHSSANRHRWRGLALYGVDGSTLRVADSEVNSEYFGKQVCGNQAQSAYPIVRVVALMALRSHLLADVCIGPYSIGETTYAKQLWNKVPNNSFTIVDRGYLDAGSLIPLAAQGENRHWLTRAKSSSKWKVLENLGPGDDLVEIAVSDDARKKNPNLPAKWELRAISYQRKGFQPHILLTSMVDPVAYPAAEIIPLYHERWEIELGYDEMKTEMLDREETIRSKTVDGVKQELWGLFLAYNLVRLEMERIAEEAGVEPTRISFVAALRYIQDEMLWCAVSAPGAIPKKLQRLRAHLKRFILPPRRSERSYERAIKALPTKYPKRARKLN